MLKRRVLIVFLGMVVVAGVAVATAGPAKPIPAVSDGSDAFGAPEASTSWFFAEGYTGAGFQEYLTLANPTAATVNASIGYVFNGGGGQSQMLALPPTSRTTVDVNAVVGANHEVSARVDASMPIVAERPLYFRASVGNAGPIDGGDDVVGSPRLSQAWYFAEGFTGEGFQEYVTIQNPTTATATVQLVYAFTDGTTLPSTRVVPSGARSTVDVNAVVGADREVSFSAISDQPVMVERPVYFSRDGVGAAEFVKGGHDVVGAWGPSTVLYFAEGFTGQGFQEYITVQNPNPTPAHVDATFQLNGGTTKTAGLDLPPTSRGTLDVNAVLGTGVEASVVLRSSVPVVAERPLYFAFACTTLCLFRGGHDAVGVTDTATSWFFAEGYTGKSPTVEFREYLTLQNPNPFVVSVPITFYLGTGATPTTSITLPASSRGTVTVADVVGPNQEVSAKVGPASAPIVAERPMYFNTAIPQEPPRTTSPGCHLGDPFAGVYSPQRLQLIDSCKTVVGTVTKTIREADGDVHIRLAPDDPSVLTDANYSGQGGNLVLEIIPVTCPAAQASRGPCGSAVAGIPPLPTPAVGARISATGPYVYDLQHGGWAEIHPVEEWHELSAAPTSPPPPSGINVTFVSVTSPVARGGTATAAVQTAGGANCTITVTYSSGPSSAAGLVAKNADSGGRVSWSWTVGNGTTPGSWPIDVRCSQGGQTASSRAFFTVQ